MKTLLIAWVLIIIACSLAIIANSGWALLLQLESCIVVIMWQLERYKNHKN